ncbi:hypothetical protein RQP46_010076 [Phenoliferia psychrophenolica]
MTCEIRFAPLTSTLSPSDLTPTPISQLSQNEVNGTEIYGSSIGTERVSPKSVYRLAHYLDLVELQDLALDVIESELTVENILEELLGETAREYEEIREVEMRFALEYWGEVKKQTRVPELLETMEEGSTEWILLKLAIGV